MNLRNDPIALLLTGRSASHLVPAEGKHRLHPHALQAFQSLQSEAKKDGLDLQLVSSFRDYTHQESIWNKKVTKLSGQNPDSIIDEILRWSALPGTSRHHWGTDLDFYDASKATLESVKLEPHEYEGTGPFSSLSSWLDEKIKSKNAFGFYRPYQTDRGGTSPEKWHLSFAPLAHDYFQKFSQEIYLENILDSSIALRENVLNRAEELYERFFKSIDLP